MSAENLRLKEAVASMREVMVKMSKVRTRLHASSHLLSFGPCFAFTTLSHSKHMSLLPVCAAVPCGHTRGLGLAQHLRHVEAGGALFDWVAVSSIPHPPPPIPMWRLLLRSGEALGKKITLLR